MNGGLYSSRGGVPDKGGDFVTAGVGSSRTAFHKSYPAVPASVSLVRAALKQYALGVGLATGTLDRELLTPPQPMKPMTRAKAIVMNVTGNSNLLLMGPLP